MDDPVLDVVRLARNLGLLDMTHPAFAVIRMNDLVAKVWNRPPVLSRVAGQRRDLRAEIGGRSLAGGDTERLGIGHGGNVLDERPVARFGIPQRLLGSPLL